MINHIFDASSISLICYFSLVNLSFPACGGNIYINDFNPSGYTSSPNYPSNYPLHADCVWTITAPNGHAVELQFEDQFYIEPSPKYIPTLFSLCFLQRLHSDSSPDTSSNSSHTTPPDLQSKMVRKYLRSLKLSGHWYTFPGLCSA